MDVGVGGVDVGVGVVVGVGVIVGLGVVVGVGVIVGLGLGFGFAVGEGAGDAPGVTVVVPVTGGLVAVSAGIWPNVTSIVEFRGYGISFGGLCPITTPVLGESAFNCNLNPAFCAASRACSKVSP